jgi:hypothetical protein
MGNIMVEASENTCVSAMIDSNGIPCCESDLASLAKYDITPTGTNVTLKGGLLGFLADVASKYEYEGLTIPVFNIPNAVEYVCCKEDSRVVNLVKDKKFIIGRIFLKVTGYEDAGYFTLIEQEI